MASKNGTIAFIAGALIAYLFVSTSSNTIEEKTVYFQYCSDFQHNVFDCPSRRNVTKKTFKIFIDRQMIVEKGDFFPTVFKSCIVFDKDNWQCEKEKGQTISMTEGNIYNSDGVSVNKEGNRSSLPIFNQISAITYYVFSELEFLNNFK